MSFIATRLGVIAPAETMEMAARAATLRRQGLDVISLSQGEPDFNTPEHIQQAAMRAMQSGQTRYTEAAGVLALRTAVAAKMQVDHDLHYTADEVSITAGAKQAIFNAFFATLNPGDEVVVPAPCWVSYPEIVKLTGGTPIVVECPREAGFKLTPAQLEACITPRTKWLMLNSPSNPTGAVYSKEELEALGTVLRRHPQVWVLTDDIYEKLIYGSEPFANILQVLPDLQPRTLIINGVSKVYCMTGWRIGYAVGPRELIKAMTLIQGQSTNNANAIAQVAAVEALTGDQSCVDTFRAAFHERRDFIVDALRKVPGLEVDVPQGAFYVYVSCRALIGKRTPQGQVLATDRDFVRYLLDAAHVAVVSGTGFLHSPYFRVSYAAGLELLDKAVQRIHKAVSVLE
ncbi:pyridoxal phosphate-dependent aminotransferase [Diaphorobacter caeni]|uniref:pyridoxal phosphate-dependent aminotransferase n=1 Tax=Diaphorobacter caeni TaxID=2784387 RepID=UPI00188E8A2F|nr:pyridoxal phosphate-dependent aminotransferase [Diaphorobacter caeni]MBF5006912.1 pyridoxal phosphate-dependent aminotransferase [Diaphorobacter caeni]